MKDDIRRHTFCIIRRNGEYMAGRILGSNDIRWTIYAHEAVKTRNRQLAEEIARKIGGIVVLYNDITLETKIL